MEMEDEKFRKPIQRAKSFASVERMASCEDVNHNIMSREL